MKQNKLSKMNLVKLVKPRPTAFKQQLMWIILIQVLINVLIKQLKQQTLLSQKLIYNLNPTLQMELK